MATGLEAYSYPTLIQGYRRIDLDFLYPMGSGRVWVLLVSDRVGQGFKVLGPISYPWIRSSYIRKNPPQKREQPTTPFSRRLNLNVVFENHKPLVVTLEHHSKSHTHLFFPIFTRRPSLICPLVSTNFIDISPSI